MSTSTMDVQDVTIHPGSLIGDLWVVRATLGTGAMGSVFLCHNRHAPRILAAVKLLAADRTAIFDARSRFAREAELLYGLDHPNIVKVRNVRLDGPHPHLEMEFVDGPSLETRIQAGPMPLDTALLIAEQIGSAVRYLHRHGICHRDIKPANVLLWKNTVVKVVDFGLALESWADRITEVGMAFGTVSYAPPEWVTPEELDPRAWDVYAIGVVLYEMLTGTVAFPTPFTGSPRQTAIRVMSEKQLVECLDPGERIPEPVRNLVRRLTALRPSDRPATAREVVHELQALLAERSIDPDEHLLRALGEDELAAHVAIDRMRRYQPLAGRFEDSTQSAEPPSVPVPTGARVPMVRRVPLPALVATVASLAWIAAVSVFVTTLGGLAWTVPNRTISAGPSAATVAPPVVAAGTVDAFVAPEPVRETWPASGSLVTPAGFADWLDDHKEWAAGRAVRKGMADAGYLATFDERDAGAGAMRGVSFSAAAAYCADKGGVARVDALPHTWDGGVAKEWRLGAGGAALRTRSGHVTVNLRESWVEASAAFRCSR